MSGSLTGDGAPKELRDQADAEDEAESTRVDRNLDALKAGVAERRAAHLRDVPDKHNPDL